MDKTAQLKDRVEAKKHELMSRLHELRADARAEVAEEAKSLKAKLDEVEAYLREGFDKASSKLENWLKKN